MLNRLFRQRQKRTEYVNLFDQLCNISTCYDLRQASDDQIIRLWGNTTRLIDGVLKGMESRGMDINEILDISKRSLANGALQNDPDSDTRLL